METRLKKEFDKKDVQRLRNLISGNFGDNTTIQVGYDKFREDHKEGDVWDEFGKTWTVKDGIKQRFDALEDIRKSVVPPMFCPKCGKIMNSHHDDKFYAIKGFCYDCSIKDDTEKVRLREYESYARKFQLNNVREYIKDAREIIISQMNACSSKIYTEDGDEQNIVGGLSMRDVAQKWLDELDEYEKTIENEYQRTN